LDLRPLSPVKAVQAALARLLEHGLLEPVAVVAFLINRALLRAELAAVAMLGVVQEQPTPAAVEGLGNLMHLTE
jgi:hypothetical protein